MVIPAMILIVIFSYLPMYGVLMAFQDYDIFQGFLHSPWVGFKYFQMFFEAPEFWTVMRNTIVISALRPHRISGTYTAGAYPERSDSLALQTDDPDHQLPAPLPVLGHRVRICDLHAGNR